MAIVIMRDTCASINSARVERHGLKSAAILTERQLLTNLANPLPCQQTDHELQSVQVSMMAMVLTQDTCASMNSARVQRHGLKSAKISTERQLLTILANPLPCQQTGHELQSVQDSMMAMVLTQDTCASMNSSRVQRHGFKLAKILMERQLLTNLANPLPCQQTGNELQSVQDSMMAMVLTQDTCASMNSSRVQRHGFKLAKILMER